MRKLKVRETGFLRLRDSELTLHVVENRVRETCFRLQQRDWHTDLGYESGTLEAQIDITKAEFIAILRFGLIHLNVDTKLIESVVPKLTKANIVR